MEGEVFSMLAGSTAETAGGTKAVVNRSMFHRWLPGMTSVMLIALTGCQCMRENTFTGKLWETDDFRHFRGPDTNAPITVYAIPGREEFLVTYLEVRDSADRPRTRALLLRADQTADAATKPRFVSTNMAGLRPISGMSEMTPLPHAAVSSNAVVIQFADGSVQRHVLPEYESASGAVTKAALTPLTIVGDATLVSLITAVIAAIAVAHSGAPYSGSL